MPGLPPGPLTPHPRCLWGQPRRARPLQPPCDPRGTPRPRSWSPFPPTARCCPPPGPALPPPGPYLAAAGAAPPGPGTSRPRALAPLPPGPEAPLLAVLFGVCSPALPASPRFLAASPKRPDYNSQQPARHRADWRFRAQAVLQALLLLASLGLRREPIARRRTAPRPAPRH